MKTSNPHAPGLEVKTVPNTVNGGLGTGKVKAAYPSGKITNKPGGGGSTGTMGKRAMTPGTSPTGS